MRAFIILRHDYTIELVTPNSAAFVTALKTTIPSWALEYDGETGSWRVYGVHCGAAIQLAQTYYYTELLVPATAPPGDPLVTLAQRYPHHYALCVLPHAPRAVIGAAYRALARRWRPDVGPDPDATRQMRALSIAYAALRR